MEDPRTRHHAKEREKSCGDEEWDTGTRRDLRVAKIWVWCGEGVFERERRRQFCFFFFFFWEEEALYAKSLVSIEPLECDSEVVGEREREREIYSARFTERRYWACWSISNQDIASVMEHSGLMEQSMREWIMVALAGCASRQLPSAPPPLPEKKKNGTDQQLVGEDKKVCSEKNASLNIITLTPVVESAQPAEINFAWAYNLAFPSIMTWGECYVPSKTGSEREGGDGV
jgi:hypothetical protein